MKYKIGDRIRIINHKSKYYGYTGEVYGVFCRTLYLLIDGTIYKKQDPPLTTKCLQLVETSVERIKKENSMAKKLLGFEKVAVINIGGCNYYYALYDDIKAGQSVLVTGVKKGEVLKVVEVITKEEAEERFKKSICEEVMTVVDLSDYQKRVEDRKKKEQIKLEMDKIIKEMDEARRYEMYAESNPELQELLNRFKSITV